LRCGKCGKPICPPIICLAQALTLQALQLREGIRSDLAIVMAGDNESGIADHACLETEGTMIIVERYGIATSGWRYRNEHILHGITGPFKSDRSVWMEGKHKRIPFRIRFSDC